MKRDGNICRWYLNLEGACSLNGSLCCNPFGIEGCDIQCRDIFKEENTQHKHYDPNMKDKKITKRKVWEMLGVKKYDIIADWIIPYEEMEVFGTDPGIAIHYAMEKVNDKFKQAGIEMNQSGVFHNVEVLNGKYGVYVIGVKHK